MRGCMAVGTNGVGDLGVAAILLARCLQQGCGRLAGYAAIGATEVFLGAFPSIQATYELGAGASSGPATAT